LVLILNMGTDAEGYAISEKYQIRTSTNAFVCTVGPMRESSTWFSWLGMDNIAQTKWMVTSVDPGKEVFAGWIRKADVESYLNFRYEIPEYWSWYTRPYIAELIIPSTVINNQGSPSQIPSELTTWVETTSTSSISTFNWDPHWNPNTGYYMLVIMNADGSSNVNADLQLGFKVPILGWLPNLLLPLGIILLIAGILLLRMRKER
jgi:hypothetical protein